MATAHETPVKRRLLAFMRIAAVLLVGFMVLQLVAQWQSAIRIQVDRLDGQTEPGVFEDYVVFYAAGKLAWDGRAGELYDLDALAVVEEESLGRPTYHGVLVYLNPPFVAAALAPLGLFALPAASTVLFAMTVMSICAGGYLLQRFIRIGSSGGRAAFWLTYLSLAAVPWMAAQGQLSMLPFIGLLGFVAAQHKGNDKLSGVALALVLVKPHLAAMFVIVLILKRRWDALKAFGAISGGLCLVSLFMGGPSIFVDYPRLVLESTGWERESGVNLRTCSVGAASQRG